MPQSTRSPSAGGEALRAEPPERPCLERINRRVNVRGFSGERINRSGFDANPPERAWSSRANDRASQCGGVCSAARRAPRISGSAAPGARSSATCRGGTIQPQRSASGGFPGEANQPERRLPPGRRPGFSGFGFSMGAHATMTRRHVIIRQRGRKRGGAVDSAGDSGRRSKIPRTPSSVLPLFRGRKFKEIGSNAVQ